MLLYTMLWRNITVNINIGSQDILKNIKNIYIPLVKKTNNNIIYFLFNIYKNLKKVKFKWELKQQKIIHSMNTNIRHPKFNTQASFAWQGDRISNTIICVVWGLKRHYTLAHYFIMRKIKNAVSRQFGSQFVCSSPNRKQLTLLGSEGKMVILHKWVPCLVTTGVYRFP